MISYPMEFLEVYRSDRAIDKELHWEKDGAAWDDQTQRYQINYYFDYIEKRRPTA